LRRQAWGGPTGTALPDALLRSVVFIAAALAELTSLTVHFVRGKTIGHHA